MSNLQSVCRDHNHLAALVRAAGSALADGDAGPLSALAGRLRQHLRIEEEQLFPAAERLVDDPSFHLTATLRREHDVLRGLLAEVEQELARDNFAGARGNLSELATTLVLHQRKERQVLFPMLERLLGEGELPAIAEPAAQTH
jgi:hemerythrin-like domain-containing protein